MMITIQLTIYKLKTIGAESWWFKVHENADNMKQYTFSNVAGFFIHMNNKRTSSRGAWMA